MIKAIFFDFDGTMFSHTTNSIPQSTIEAIKILNDKGIKSFLCTGRAAVELFWFDIDDVKLYGKILSNGQLVLDENDNLIFESVVEGKLKEEMLRIFNEKRIPIYLATDKSIFLNFNHPLVDKVQNAVSSNVPPVAEYNGEKIYMGSIFFEDEKTYNEIMKLSDLAYITCWQEGALDIIPKGFSKSTGIDAILKHFNIDIDETMAFGDGENDIDMIQHCKIGVAMANGVDSLKAVADYVTDDIDEDGVYNALKYYKLI